MIAAGGTITHHHAVGRDHRPWYDRQRPEPFARALRAAKARARSGGDPQSRRADRPVSVHRYSTSVAWDGSTAAGYEDYSREHSMQAADESLRMSSDPAFRGDGRLLNPEQLLVAAASSCQLLEFLALAAKARVDVVEYHDEAEGTMDDEDDPARIQRIVLRPRIRVGPGPAREKVERLVHLAHEHCYVANSLTTEIVVEPVIA